MKRPFAFFISFLFTGLFLFSSRVNAEDRHMEPPAWRIKQRSTDKTIRADKALLVFTCYAPSGKKLKNGHITVHANGKQHSVLTDSTGVTQIETSAGKYRLYLYGYRYKEITTDSITFSSQEKIEIIIRFSTDNEPRPVRKPVIYLYPNEKTDVQVSLDVKGELFFTYPVYNNGWNVTAHPNGKIEYNNQTYNYLFWESHTTHALPQNGWQEGFIVRKDSLLAFLENSVTQFGLTSSEAQDFITYWYPQMILHEELFIHFVVNDECNQYAGLTITPQPAQIHRLYMVWGNTSNLHFTNLRKQTLPVAPTRTGFTVVEWGGIELKTTDLIFCGN